MAPNAVNTFLDWISDKQDRKHEDMSSFSHSGANSTGTSISFLTGAVPRGYNLIVSNPPYIAASDFETLEPEVAQWEDPKALLADQEGLVFYPLIAKMAMELLDRNRTWRNGPDLDKVRIPELVFEIGGDHQVDSVSAAVRSAGFSRVQVWWDLAEKARCIVGAR
jgi:methylase of polypeptide subunit release factors